jgi:copper chaperone
MISRGFLFLRLPGECSEILRRWEVNMMSETVLKIEGMTCMHCKMSVEKALKGVPGVTSALVDLAKKQAVIAGSADLSVMAKAVAEAGFKVAG